MELNLWTEQLIKNDKGIPKPCTLNALLFLENEEALRGRFRWNSFTSQVEVSGLPWAREAAWLPLSDNDVTQVLAHLDKFHVAFGPDAMFRAVATVAARYAVHPVREYLSGLNWDGVSRIDALFAHYFVPHEDTPLTREIGRRFLIGAVARVFQPGCKHDTYPVLEGQQGILKSSSIRALVPDPTWFSDTKFDLGQKDAYMVMQGVWIYEVAELETFKGASATQLKSFTSSAVDRYRPPYGRVTQSVPRQTVFIASTNDTDYVQDSTGERRMQPVAIQGVNRDAVLRDRDQLWAEAYVAYAAGERWHLEGEAAAAAKAEAMKRHIEDPWGDVIRREAVLGANQRIQGLGKPEAQPVEYVPNTDIYGYLELQTSRLTPYDTRRLTKVLKQLGFVSLGKRRFGKQVKNAWQLPNDVVKEAQEMVDAGERVSLKRSTTSHTDIKN